MDVNAKALAKAVRSYRNAHIEMQRASDAMEQPRLRKAGDRLFLARGRMFTALDRLTKRPTSKAGETR